MFLTSHRGYTRDGQQLASGRFLVLFSQERYKVGRTPDYKYWTVTDIATGKVVSMFDDSGQGNSPAYAWIKANGGMYNLYAHVCYVKMKQLGHFMMGDSKTLKVNKDYGTPGSAPNYLILSGTYGGDGLGCDYEDLTPESRAKLVPVPPELAAKFWDGGGHNEAGSEAFDMRDWAIKTFPERKRPAKHSIG